MNTNDSVTLLHDLLGPLDTLLKRGDAAYKRYMTSNKTYLYARILYVNNIRIRDLLLRQSHRLPADQHSNAIELITHIDIWSVLWNALNDSKRHHLDDEFAFENAATFPRQSVESLLAYYEELKMALSE